MLRIEGKFPDPGTYQILFCDQCGECAKVCPTEAIELEDGIYKINQDECTGCYECVEACPLSLIIINQEDEMPAKCILCGECAKVCPREAIMILKKENAIEDK